MLQGMWCWVVGWLGGWWGGGWVQGARGVWLLRQQNPSPGNPTPNIHRDPAAWRTFVSLPLLLLPDTLVCIRLSSPQPCCCVIVHIPYRTPLLLPTIAAATIAHCCYYRAPLLLSFVCTRPPSSALAPGIELCVLRLLRLLIPQDRTICAHLAPQIRTVFSPPVAIASSPL
jgi:hypothetical protein